MTNEEKEGFFLVVEIIFEDNAIFSHDEISKAARKVFYTYYAFSSSRKVKISYRPFDDTEKWIQKAFHNFCFVYVEKLMLVQGKEVLVLQEPESIMFRDLLVYKLKEE